MASISPSELAQELLARSLEGQSWPDAILDPFIDAALDSDPARARPAAQALFGLLVERLADLFEPALCDAYAAEFSKVLARALPELSPEFLLARYQRVRQPRRFQGDAGAVGQVFVLSRVTLGADVAVTSVMLDAVKRRFPQAQVFFVGGRKGYELFGGDGRIAHLPVAYQRGGTLRDRLAGWPALRRAVSEKGSMVVDPDSRLTQLGLLPVCPEENYYFFESRAYGGHGDAPLGELARRWARETFGVEDARAWITPADRPAVAAGITVSFGVGENPAKRVPDPFEAELLGHLAGLSATVLVDTGAGGEEAERVERAIRCAATPANCIRAWEGAFAPFAAAIAASRLYVGYDSAGGHVAAACGVPLVSVFAGFPSVRMFHRWRPSGPGLARVVRVDVPDPAKVLAETVSALEYSSGGS